MTNFIVICHGKSEIVLAKWIQNKTRVVLNIDSRNDGKNSVMINSLLEFMREGGYYDNSKLKRRYPNIEYKNRKGFKDLRIFIVMDVDNDESMVDMFMTKAMFKDCPLKDCIVPILNRKEMDGVFRSMGFDIDAGNKPESYRDALNTTDVDQLLESLKLCDNTNLDEMIEEILIHDPSHQGNKRCNARK